MNITRRRSIAAARIGPIGRYAVAPRKVTGSDGFIAEAAIGQHAHQCALVEALADLQHRIDVTDGDDLRRVSRRQRGQHGIDLARVVLVHRHCQPKSGALSPIQRSTSKLPMCAPIRKAPPPAATTCVHQRFALQRHLEQVVALGQQVDAIVDRGGERHDLAEAVDGARLAPQCAPQVVAHAAPGPGRKHEVIAGNQVQEHASRPAGPGAATAMPSMRSSERLPRSGRRRHSATAAARAGASCGRTGSRR